MSGWVYERNGELSFTSSITQQVDIIIALINRLSRVTAAPFW